MSTAIEKVKQAIQDLQQGKIIILTDCHNRENEGDFVMAAEKITPEAMNFIIRNSSGIVCVSIDHELMNKLQLKYMVPKDLNSSPKQTPFTISIDSKHGITTGVSAYDRYKTVYDMITENSEAQDFVMPGHIFPLCAKPGGVLERDGHTEGSLDLIKLAGLKSAAVLCEVMNADGTMARADDLSKLSQQYGMTQLSIQDIIHYRLQHEINFIETPVVAIPTECYGTFNAFSIKESVSQQEHLVLFNELPQDKPVLVRIHSSCLTGDVFHSNRCDCHDQLHYAMRCIAEEGGLLIYLNQEGRGIGLFNKIKAYHLQDQGYDTVEANEQLGFSADAREYYIAAAILKKLNIQQVSLLTNNPHKVNSLKQYGITNILQRPIPLFENEKNKSYLKTKQEKLHQII